MPVMTGLTTVYVGFAGLSIEFTVTVTGPVVDPLGTIATICVLPQLVTDALVPLKLIELVP